MAKSSLMRALVLVLALALGAAAPAFPLPLMDMRADDLLALAPEFAKSLDLNPNQQTLWRQVEGRSRAVLRERQARRERLQQQAAAQLDKANLELRDLGKALDEEAAATGAEDKTLRELWLTVNDALDEVQRRKVATLVAEQMMRVPETARVHDAPAGHPEGGGHGRGGMGHGRGGAGMGAPGG